MDTRQITIKIEECIGHKTDDAIGNLVELLINRPEISSIEIRSKDKLSEDDTYENITLYFKENGKVEYKSSS